MIGLPGRIVEAIMHGPESGSSASVSMAGVSSVDGSLIIPERPFQFWPETLSEEPEIGWSFKEIPGLSHALAQWTQNGGRTFTFEVQLSRFMKPMDDLTTKEQILSLGLNRPDATIPLNNQPMNISVRDQVQWLRQFYLPDYVTGTVQGLTNAVVSVAPPIAVLCFPRMGLNEDSTDVIWTVMTQCSVTYALCFPSGEPRLATVSLGFKQVIQWPGQGLVPKSRVYHGDKMLPDYEMNIGVGGGRKDNKIDVKVGP